MRVLLVCSQGMSSVIALKALQVEANNHSIEMEAMAVGIEEFKQEIAYEWDVALIAPQIRHRFRELEALAFANDIPCACIDPQGYSPMGGPMMFKQVNDLMIKK